MGDFLTKLKASPINIHVDNASFSDNPQLCAAQIQKMLEKTQILGTKLLSQQASLQYETAHPSNAGEQKVSPSLIAQLRGVQNEMTYLLEEGKRYNASTNTTNAVNKENLNERGILSANGSLSPKKPGQKPRRSMGVRAEDTADAIQISQQLLAECERQHAVIVEKDEQIKSTHADNVSMESQIQLLQSKIRDTNDLEGRYKEENWNLELDAQNLRNELLQTRDSLRKSVLDHDSSKKVIKDLLESGENLKVSETELQSELQRVKQKLELEKASFQYEIETLQTENEEAIIKIQALTSELQDEKATNSRPVISTLPALSDIPENDFGSNPVTPENSPPQSPIKGTPSRHGHLETETMRTSLSHAQRHIANLKSTIQRQRVESRDLRRKLTELQDKENWSTENRSTQKSAKTGKRKTNAHGKRNSRDILRADKSPRSGIETVESEASDWEEDRFETAGETEAFETARETDAFETANDLTATEPENTANETEGYRTGGESLMADSSDDTETEANAVRHRANELLENDSDGSDSEMAHGQINMNERLSSRGIIGMRPTSTLMNVRAKSLLEELDIGNQEPTDLETVEMCDVGVMTSLIETRVETRDIGVMTENLVRAISFKSSVSSFASEVDERFHLKQSLLAPYTGTMDPPLVRAVTQTMIGEYLWKYTRKSGRSTLSENRHQRFFWLHPYTRTLYWSVVDPSTPGQSDSKARSGLI